MPAHVYLMPGMAASPKIFNFIKLPEEDYVIHKLQWIIPETSETLQEYATRISKEITEPDPILIGVSFGGVLVQEIAKIIHVDKLVLVSSVKSKYELPKRMNFSRKLALYNIAPVSIFKNLPALKRMAPNKWLKKKLSLYEKYLSVNDPKYLSWALEQMLCWEQEEPPQPLVHIHGDADTVFPHKYIKNCITVPNGTHIMIITQYLWFNKKLPDILENYSVNCVN